MAKEKQDVQKTEKEDHIVLGKRLDLFVQNDVIGQGLPLLTPKGAMIKMILRRFIEDEEMRRGFVFTDTPVMAKTDLYKISGHLSHYKDKMFIFENNDEEVALRPMTCPHQFMIYKSKARSYRELPIRYAEIASLFRNEQSGEMHGLIRIKQFTLADTHVICTPEQVENEFKSGIELIQYVMDSLGFKDYWYRFSKWDPKNKEKYIDNPKAWNDSQKMMKRILDELEMKYIEAEDEAAFYGPKLDIQMKNVYGKEDTLFTVQIDFALPERFDMTYKGADNEEHRPMIIHSSHIGCLERVMALLIEQYQGALPVWLSPVQVKVISFTDKHIPTAERVLKSFKDEGIRAEGDFASSTVNDKVRNAELMKIPYIIVIGDKEEQNTTLAVRARGKKPQFGVKLNDFLEQLKTEVNERK